MNQSAIYLPNSSYLNEATSFYIDMICEGIFNESPKIIHRINELKKYNIVLVIDAKSCVLVKLRYPSLKVITWYQGIVPEEALMVLGSNIRYIFWSILEVLSLRLSSFNIFVSDAMKTHYERKYNYKNRSDIIIPCFNKEVKNDVVYGDRGLSFVYAGSLHKWQCIDRMLSIFHCIQIKQPHAKLDFYTFDVNEATVLIKKFNLKNVDVRVVGLDKIDEEISKSKYGFLIREEHVVNNVATPTKLSTYLSVGTKPILTDVIMDFRKHIDGRVCIYLGDSMSASEAADAILNDYEKQKTSNCNTFLSARDELFKSYFNKRVYIEQLKKIFSIK